MTWGEPRWFWALLVLPAILALMLRTERWRRRALHEFVGQRLAPRLISGLSYRRRWVRNWMMLLALALIVVALARPQYGFDEVERDDRSGDIVFLMDTSRSMLAADVRPNRLERCKLAAQDLLQFITGDFVGVVAVAGTTFVQAPLTTDYDAVGDTIRETDTTVLPVGGTRFEVGLHECERLMEIRPGRSKAIVFFTDGEDLEGDAAAAAKELAGKGIVVHAVAFGTTEGSVIQIPGPNGGTDFVRDPDGNIVHSRLDLEKLRAITGAGGGMLVQPANEPRAIERLWREGLSSISRTRQQSRLERIPIERYQVPLGAAILLLVVQSLMNDRSRRAAPGAGLQTALAK